MAFVDTKEREKKHRPVYRVAAQLKILFSYHSKNRHICRCKIVVSWCSESDGLQDCRAGLQRVGHVKHVTELRHVRHGGHPSLPGNGVFRAGVGFFLLSQPPFQKR